MKIGIGIRFYEKNPHKLYALEKFIRDAEKHVDLVYIIVNNEKDATGAYKYITKLKLPKTQIFLMNIWGKFTPALNAIAYNTALAGVDRLVFCSPEIGLTYNMIKTLNKHVDKNTLVAGAKLDGHDFKLGKHKAIGSTIPWNTLAIWNLPLLIRTGFILVSDAPFNPKIAGIEEYTTCAVQQALYPSIKIKLVNIPNIHWNIEDLDAQRKKTHNTKIQTKNSRAKMQLAYLKIKAPTVIHVK